eukprot:3526564-Ditylum_brightwellii.AAC.1
MSLTIGNILTMRMLTAGKKFCIKHDTFIGWRQTLKKDLAERSIVPMEKITDIASCMDNVQQKMALLTIEIRETKAEVAYPRKENADLRVLVEEMHSFLIGKKVEGIQVRNEGPENPKEHQQ